MVLRRSISVLMVVLASSLAWAETDEKEYRNFIDAEGRTFLGKLLAFDAKAATAKLKRSDGKTGSIKLDVFSEADQLYIMDWVETKRLMEELDIQASYRSKIVPPKESASSDASRSVVEAGYTIQLKNNSKSPFTKIDVEYCIFYKQGKRNGSTIVYEEGTSYGKSSFKELKPEDSAETETKNVKLSGEGGGSQTLFGTIDEADSSVRGIWIRLKAPLPSGGSVVRDYKSVDDPTWKWTSGSVSAGLNPSDNPYVLKLPF